MRLVKFGPVYRIEIRVTGPLSTRIASTSANAIDTDTLLCQDAVFNCCAADRLPFLVMYFAFL